MCDVRKLYVRVCVCALVFDFFILQWFGVAATNEHPKEAREGGGSEQMTENDIVSTVTWRFWQISTQIDTLYEILIGIVLCASLSLSLGMNLS